MVTGRTFEVLDQVADLPSATEILSGTATALHAGSATDALLRLSHTIAREYGTLPGGRLDAAANALCWIAANFPVDVARHAYAALADRGLDLARTRIALTEREVRSYRRDVEDGVSSAETATRALAKIGLILGMPTA